MSFWKLSLCSFPLKTIAKSKGRTFSYLEEGTFIALYKSLVQTKLSCSMASLFGSSTSRWCATMLKMHFKRCTIWVRSRTRSACSYWRGKDTPSSRPPSIMKKRESDKLVATNDSYIHGITTSAILIYPDNVHWCNWQQLEDYQGFRLGCRILVLHRDRRDVAEWNSLPEAIVTSPSVNYCKVAPWRSLEEPAYHFWMLL